MYMDIAALIRNALKDSGIDESLLGDFDSHSTIALEFDNFPSLLISTVDEQVWIWSQLCENVPGVLGNKMGAVLEKLMEGCQFSMTGQLQLAVNDDMIELKGMVHPRYLESSTAFAEVLDEFFSHQETYLEIIR